MGRSPRSAAAPARHAVEPDDRARSSEIGRDCTMFAVRRTMRALGQVYDAHLRPTGLRGTQFSLLNVIRARSPARVKTIAGTLASDRTTVTRNLQPLERRGLILIEPGEDRRERVVSITRKGHELLERAIPLWDTAQAEVAELLGERRTARVLGDLSELSKVAD